MKIDPTKVRALLKARGLTNTQLAVRAGISRQALQTVLRQEHVADVRERTVKGLTQALRLPDASLLSPDPLVGYKEAVADEHADLTFRGLGLPTTEPRSLDSLYVSIRVREAVSDQKRSHDCQPPPAVAETEPVKEPVEVPVAQCLDRYRRVLICGDPGSGKTIALRNAARVTAQGPAANGHSLKLSRVPLFVRLADFAKARERDGAMTLVRFVVMHTLRDSSSEYWSQVEQNIAQELRRGNCLILLDGLDEVGGGGDFSTVLRMFIDEFGENQFVITSRIVGLDAGTWQKLGFATFKVARWGEDEIRKFAQLWYEGRPTAGKKQPKRQLNQQADEFTEAILGHPPLREIASNPLMLTILAALHHANPNLPRRRVDLYAKIAEVMTESWEADKRDSRPGDPLHGVVLEARDFGWLLARLALGMQRDGHTLRPRWWVTDFIRRFLRDQMALGGDQEKDQGERVIRYLCERTGLLVERGDGVFGFWHRTFQEYFAARGLLLEVEDGGNIVALLRPYLFYPQWEEVVVLAAASLTPTRATMLVGAILDDPDPAGRFLRRGQRLALRCLVDGAAVADRALLDQVFSGGEAIGNSRWLAIPIGFNTLLNLFRLTRHEADARRMLDEIEDGTRQLPERDYVTVHIMSHDPPAEPRDCAPGTVYRRRFGTRQVELISLAWKLRVADPDQWFAQVLHRLRDPKAGMRSKLVLISVLGDDSEPDGAARRTLKELLVRAPSPEIRARCAEALEDVVSSDSKLAKLALDRLNKDKADVVRGRCAEILRGVAQRRPDVRTRLEELLAAESPLVRAGAVRGLSRLDFTLPEQEGLLQWLLTTIVSPAESVHVRCASIWAVAPLLGREEMAEVEQVVVTCVADPDPKVSKAALHILADAIAEGRRRWSQPLVERIEAMLMAITDPCPHLFGDLVAIVAMKEVHGQRQLERRLGDSLNPFGDHISLAFVFGSVARLEQVQNSDIDLMVIGDVRLKDVAAALHIPEQVLGRPVNPVLFSPEKFREGFREGNPFLLDVVRKEKVFLKGSRDELTELVADRSPD